ncbi:hypothetical protein [Legionella maioricensis]|uniref:Uncharacterized protein n=1 Tax=Legionella maioricensis TaxID=2896528 RepID=A0A9X2CZF8_9GAMM|nr:hypothetical protein [Legionella maioricensis]MCL9683566.1 hypothetical protein [Legionella maioricensis]MCL9686865.1 hypothetical protein [Legionella maioricensis]
MLNVVLFAEDPGAVNYITPLVFALTHQGHSVLLLSAGVATELFQNKGISSLTVSNGEEAVKLLHDRSPELLLVGTSENLDSPAFALISAAKAMQCVSIGVVDFYANAAYRFRGRTNNPFAFAPDWLMVPDEYTAKEYESLGFLKQNIFVAGHPHYDDLIKMKKRLDGQGRDVIREKLFPDAWADQTIIVFASELSTGLNAEQYQFSNEYTLIGRGSAVGRTEIVVEELLDSLERLIDQGVKKPYLVLRRHPKETLSDLSDYTHEFNLVSQGGDPLELIYAADLVVGMSSMLLSEAYALGVSVLSILPREMEKDWLPLAVRHNILCATQRNEIDTHLRGLLSNPSINSTKNEANSLSDITAGILTFLQSATKKIDKEYSMSESFPFEEIR